MLNGLPDLAAAIADFSCSPDDPTEIFEDFEPIDDDQGGETMSAVYEVGKFVIKISTAETIDRRYASDGRPLHPEDCALQFRLLNALGHHLRQSSDPEIITPEQHLAVKVDDTRSLVIMQKMAGFIRLDEWLAAAAAAGFDITGTPELVTERIQAATKGTLFGQAIADLFKPGEFSYTENQTIATFRADNIMVPKRPAQDIVSYLDYCRMAIIDQPPPFIAETDAAERAIAAYACQTGYSPIYITA